MSQLKKKRVHINIPREVLLVEIERRCREPECHAKTRIGLTKEEARAYTGFTCERCEVWQTDALAERDVPEWWEELAITGLAAIRARAADQPDEPNIVVRRMSDDYRRMKDSDE